MLSGRLSSIPKGIHMNDAQNNPGHGHEPYVLYVDAVRFTTQQNSITGAQIKQLAGLDMTLQLFLEEKGDQPDRAISDGEAVHLSHGEVKHFYAVPPATFGKQ